MHDWLTGAHAPPNDATVGKRILVNGQFAPYLTVRPGKYRLRLLNASTFSAYNLELSNGRPLVQVGTGSALLPGRSSAPTSSSVLAQRADVVVDFSGLRDKNVLLSTVPRDDGSPAPASVSGDHAVPCAGRAREPAGAGSPAPRAGARRPRRGRQGLDLRPDRGPPRVLLVDQRRDVRPEAGRPPGRRAPPSAGASATPAT